MRADMIPGNAAAILGAKTDEPIQQADMQTLAEQNGWKLPRSLMTPLSHVLNKPFIIFTCYTVFSSLFKPLLVKHSVT